MKTQQQIIIDWENKVIGTNDAVRALKEIGACACELCLRYDVVSVAEDKRIFEGEYVKTKYEFDVCQGCAFQLDCDEEQVND